jgi:large subunit ribosomal protein L15
LPIIKRLPRKRGFYNPFRVEYSPVNVGSLCLFEAGSEITPDIMYKEGIIDSKSRPVKVLARGEIKNAVTVKASKFSEAAKAKIEAAGGKAEEI